MYDKIVVPLDGSDTAARALLPAAALAAEYDATVTITTVVSPSFVPSMTENARNQAAAAGIQYPVINLVVSARSPATQLIEALDNHPGSLLCMATTGRSHLGQVLGSVAEEVLRLRPGPFLLVGPRCETASFQPGGRLLVPVDGSETADDILPLAASWAIAYEMDVEVVTVADADSDPEVAARAAAKIEADLGRPVGHTLLQGNEGPKAESVPAAIVAHAEATDTNVIAISTHGRTGLPRFVMGSIAMEVVHGATCPVLVHRPLRLRT